LQIIVIWTYRERIHTHIIYVCLYLHSQVYSVTLYPRHWPDDDDDDDDDDGDDDDDVIDNDTDVDHEKRLLVEMVYFYFLLVIWYKVALLREILVSFQMILFLQQIHIVSYSSLTVQVLIVQSSLSLRM
jgi:hypothetical protein